MARVAQEDSEHYAEYRALVEGERLPSALRNAVLIFFLLQTFVFIPADWVIFPESFQLFLAARLTMNAALCVIYFGTARPYPVASSVATCAAGGLLFLVMVYDTGGVESGYYVGLILLVIGMGVLTPQTAKQGALIACMLFAGYASLPLFTKDPVLWQTFAQHLFFLGAASVEAVWACAYMERMRFVDYKQQRELEVASDRLAELDKAKSRFSANVHHELRTPLTLILAPLDALRAGEFGEISQPIERSLATMHSNGRRLHKMINNLLDLSKLESHLFKVQRRPMHLGPLVEELVTGVRGLADRKQIRLVTEGLEDLPEINADPDALDKVLVNLLGNALKFTDGGGEIRISGEVHEGEVQLSVKDSGIGISPDQIDSIFDRFAQVDGSATRRYEGTGIGLSLAMEMVELHGGKIWAESEGEGCGTSVCFRVPIGEPDDVLAEEVLTDDRGELSTAGRSIVEIEADLNIRAGEDSSTVEMERSVVRWADSQPNGDDASEMLAAPLEVAEVLIAEDNPEMRELLVMLVGKEFRVRATKNGREALEALHERAPDLVLSDVMMPEMSGIELCTAIKSDEETRSIPVVLVTSKAEQEMKIEGLELGADDYVTKPFHPRELLARVRSLVRVASLQKHLAIRNEQLEKTLGDLKQAEVKLVQGERLAAVGELAAGIAHEVNNPINFALNAVRAMETTVKEVCDATALVAQLDTSDPVSLCARVDSIQESLPRDEVQEMANSLLELSEIVKEGLTRTHTLVGDLRDFASPGREGEMQSGVDLAKGLSATIQLMKYTLAEGNARCELRIDEGVPTIVGDPGGLNQVFLNLLKNACQALADSGGTIEVALTREGENVVIAVSDDGPGISATSLPLLFEPFFSTKEAGEGSGLGLSISRQIITAHGGSIDVESELGLMTRFTVRLPITPA